MNYFVKQPSEYKREYDIWETYIHDSSTLISRAENIDYEEAKKFVLSKVAKSDNKPKNDPPIQYLAKRTRGNRETYVSTFSEYLDEVIVDELILAPTLTVYIPPHIKKSLLGQYILENMALRSTDKAMMFSAKMAGDVNKESYFGVMQESRKTKNNSMSGAHASPSTCLYNKSSHSTLTSSCRCATSYGNANNEKFLLGNRHLWSPDIVISTLLTAINVTDFARLEPVIYKYGLYFPSVADVMECIHYSTQNYWRNDANMEEIRGIVQAMTPMERAAYVYVGDLYHLNKHNPEFVKGFIVQLRTPATIPAEDPAAIMTNINSDIKALVSLLCSDIMAGRELVTVKNEDQVGYAIVAATTEKVYATLHEYGDLISTLWRPDSLPASIFKFPSIYRKAVVTSDTDSSIFTNEYWVQEIEGERTFSKEGYGVGYVTTYLTSQIVKHYLAMLSANLGVEESMIHKLSMKNEFYFPVFSLTSAAKHYFALVSAREGNVYKEVDVEVKGVNLRSSNAPDSIMKRLKESMVEICERVMKGDTYTAKEIADLVGDIEMKITRDIRSGGHEYLHCMEIKDADSYVDKEGAGAFQHHLLWEEVFAPKYGHAGEPPYKSAKISVMLPNRTAIAKWIDSIEDTDFAERMNRWITSTGKTNITTFRLPEHILGIAGIPTEVAEIIDIRKIVIGIMKPFYMVLESLGIFMLNPKITRIISEETHAA